MYRASGQVHSSILRAKLEIIKFKGSQFYKGRSFASSAGRRVFREPREVEIVRAGERVSRSSVQDPDFRIVQRAARWRSVRATECPRCRAPTIQYWSAEPRAAARTSDQLRLPGLSCAAPERFRGQHQQRRWPGPGLVPLQASSQQPSDRKLRNYRLRTTFRRYFLKLNF